VERIIPRPNGLGEGWQDWGIANWGCATVYRDSQRHWTRGDADVIWFYTPWDPPLYAINALSAVFPEDTFLLESEGHDVPRCATLFRAGKNSQHFRLPDLNGLTGKTVTPYEIFCAVLSRNGSLAKALTEVEGSLTEPFGYSSPDPDRDSAYDATLDADIRSQLARYLVSPARMSTDQALIERHATIVSEMNEEQIRAYGTRLWDDYYSAQEL
jgi:hypothetical protein